MDSQAQLQRTHGHHQTQEPIRIHHPEAEEEEHHEKGPSKVLKKVKEKAKKIKKALTKHGHGHEHDRGEHIPDDHDLDEEDDEDDYDNQQMHGGAPARGKAHIPVKEEVVPPGTNVFPVVTSSHKKPAEPISGVEQVRGSNTSHGHEAVPRPVRPSGVSENEERRGASTLTPHNTPVSLLSGPENVTRTFLPGEDRSRDQRRVNFERPSGLEEDTAAPGGRLGSHGVVSNYQSKVTDPSGKASEEIGAPTSVAALGRRKGTGEGDQTILERDFHEKRHGFDMKPGPDLGEHLRPGSHRSGLRNEFPARSHEFDVKARSDLGADFQTGARGTHNADGFDSRVQERGDERQQTSQSSYTDKIASVTSVVADKAVAAKNAVASKLGYSGEGGNLHEGRVEGEETPSSTGGYGNKVAGMVTPVYEKVKETGASVMTKLPFSGGGTDEGQQGQDKGVSAKEYLTEKLSPGEEDKALSEVVAEKLHLGDGGETKKGIVTQSEEVEKRLGGFKDQTSEAERKHGEKFAEEGEGGMAEKLREAVTSWISGTTTEVTQKSTESVQDSSQSVGSTIGRKMGFSGSGGDEAGQRSGNSESVPLQRRFQDSRNQRFVLCFFFYLSRK